MTVRFYRSDDASAPTLSGTAGSLAALLDALLVNGYGSQPAAGWSIAFTGTNLRSYRTGSGNQFYLALDDTGTTSARIRGYESMSAVATGTGPFCTDVQVSGGLFMGKSSTANSTTRPWICLASEKVFYLCVYAAQTTLGNVAATDAFCAFGDYNTFLPGDAFNTFIIGHVATPASNSLGAACIAAGSINALAAGHYQARAYTQIGSSLTFSKQSRFINQVTQLGGSSSFGNIPYPDPIQGGYIMSPVDVWENTGSGISRRGVLPGFWASYHNGPAVHMDTLTGTGALAGKTFMNLAMWNASNQGRCLFEISNTW